MEQAKKNRKQNRTIDERRDALNAKLAFHHTQIVQLNSKIAELDKPRKPREKKDSYAKLTVDLKAAGKSPEEIRALLGMV